MNCSAVLEIKHDASLHSIEFFYSREGAFVIERLIRIGLHGAWIKSRFEHNDQQISRNAHTSDKAGSSETNNKWLHIMLDIMKKYDKSKLVEALIF